MPRTENGWIREYRSRGVLKLHNEHNAKSEHFLLTSGKHSNGYFDSPPVLKSQTLLKRIASDLVDAYFQAGGNIELIDRVVGPKTGGAKLAKALAREIALRRNRPCQWAEVSKFGEGESRMMFFTDTSDGDPAPGEVVLVCDDVFTTGGSIKLTIDAVKRARGQVLYLVCVIVNRSGKTRFENHEVAALINKEMPVWEPAECPLCAQGSEAKKPRGPQSKAS